jgi:thiamine-monophosphate kinase
VLARVAAALSDAGRAGAPWAPGEVGIGDDAAVLADPAGPVVVSVDAVVGGVHVDLALVEPGDVGWKALMAALSDLAAMGARPWRALVACGIPEGFAVDPLVAGLAAAADAARCPVVGGDLSQAGELFVSVTVLGTLDDGPRPVTRSGAGPGDALFVTGPCGGSAAGLRLRRAGTRDHRLVEVHRRPVARLEEGLVARRAGATAMIDVSDGLGLDAHRMALASGVGLRLAVAGTGAVADGATADEAMGGGEDYELVMATGDPDGLLEGFAAAGLRPPIPLGRCTTDPAERLLDGRPFLPSGWRHRF